MKKRVKRIIYAVIMLVFLSNVSNAVFAVPSQEFADISGHWAEDTLKKALNDGIIEGFDESTIAPDNPITAAQIITILCRVIGAKDSGDISHIGLSSNVWYADSAGKALNLGLISSASGNLDTPMKRQDALAIMAKTFCLIPSEPDYSLLTPFSDVGSISNKNKAALASLVSKKVVFGFDGALNVNGNITRAEFLTVLYRVVENHTYTDDFSPALKGGSILKGSGSLNNVSTGNVWFDCSSENVSINGVSADTVTLRSHALASFSIKNSSITELVIALGKGAVAVPNDSSSRIGAVRLESCDSATIGADVQNIEVTGNGILIEISGMHDNLIVTGNNNVITLSPDASFLRVKVIGENNIIKANNSSNKKIISCNEIELQGRNNVFEANIPSGSTTKITVGGTGNKVISELGNVSTLGVTGTKSNISIGYFDGISCLDVTGNDNLVHISSPTEEDEKTTEKKIYSIDSVKVSGNSSWITMICNDISSISISGKYNTVNKIGTGSMANFELLGSANVFNLYEGSHLQFAKISGSDNRIVVNGTVQSITVFGIKNAFEGSGRITSLILNAYGCTVNVATDKIDDKVSQAETERILKLVTNVYRGNYTLKWAQENDYQDFEKEIWVNAKNYSSSTGYLIWINLSMQRVNIFKGSAGNWKLCHSCIVGTGAPGSPTPIGVWKTTYKTWAGWTTSSYTVKPVVGFKQNTGYAFHSRLYYPGTTTLSDASIGYPVSHGCIRMYDADIKYIYDNIPLGTTVVVH